MVKSALVYFSDRFKEPSSWAVIFGGAASLGVALPVGTAQFGAMIGAGVAGLLGIFLAEKPKV